MTENIITTHDLWREFPREKRRYTLFEAIHKGRNNRGEGTLIALQNISITIKKGEKIEIVGNNGSCKSTLLRLVAGRISPTKGTVELNGEIAMLSYLGVGMLDDLTVQDNVYLYRAIHGIPRQDISQIYNEAVEPFFESDASIKFFQRHVRKMP
jgi:ABC-type polysaccharide/polyol phosphate transport system ATPase subunit